MSAWKSFHAPGHQIDLHLKTRKALLDNMNLVEMFVAAEGRRAAAKTMPTWIWFFFETARAGIQRSGFVKKQFRENERFRRLKSGTQHGLEWS
jgi:hypothetical protein